MKYTALLSLFLLSLNFVSIAQDNSVTGTWHGLAAFENGKLRLSLVINENNGALSGTLISPDQGNVEIPIDEVKLENQVLTVIVEAIKFEYVANYDEQNQVLTGNVIQNGTEILVNMDRNPLDSPYYRPQTPSKPYPYITEEIQFTNDKSDIKLAGTLTLPNKNKNIPIAIMISGSGPQDRDEALAYHKPFLVIADYLAKHGIGTLRYDDRGVAKSEGNFALATSEDFASDAIAGLEFLKEKGYSVVGTIGHSEGGMVSAMVGANYPIDFIISLAGTAVSGRAILEKQNFVISVAEGMSEEVARENNRKFMEMVDLVLQEPDSLKTQTGLITHIDSVYANERTMIPDYETWKQTQIAQLNNPWMRYFVQYDPCADWKKVTCPVLALNGTKDLQVDLKLNFEAMQNCLIAAGNEDFTLAPIKNQNHLFQSTETGRVSEYIEIEETFSTQTLKTIVAWLDAHFPQK